MPSLVKKLIDEVTTTNDYVDFKVGTASFREVTFTIKNTGGSNAILWRVDGANDPAFTDANEEKAEESVGAGAKGVCNVTYVYAHMRIQIKSAVADTPSTVDAWVCGVG